MECSECHAPTDRQDGFDVGDGKILCVTCFTDLGQRMLARSHETVAGDRKKLLKKWAREHTAEFVPRDVIRDVCEQGFRKMLTRDAEPEDVYSWMVNQLAFATGLAVERRTLEVLRGVEGALRGGMEELEREVRENMRKLAELGKL